jgi:hypothetical protein
MYVLIRIYMYIYINICWLDSVMKEIYNQVIINISIYVCLNTCVCLDVSSMYLLFCIYFYEFIIACIYIYVNIEICINTSFNSRIHIYTCMLIGDKERDLGIPLTFAFDRNHPIPQSKFQLVCIYVNIKV